jgi:type I restriction enzyme S subunit
VPKDLDSAIVSSHYFLFTIDQYKLDRKFLDYFIRTPDFHVQVKAQGSTNYAAIRPSHVLGYEIPLPSIVEQQRIVTWIEELSNQIKEACTLRQNIDKELGAIASCSINHYLRNLTINGTLGDILKSPPRNGWSARCDNADDGVPILTLSAVTGFRYRGSEFKRTSVYAANNGYFWLRAGDLLISRSNTLELVGHAAIYDGSPSPCIYPDLMMRLDTQDNKVDKRFVWYWLRSSLVRRYIELKAKGTSPTMKKISQSVVLSIPFPISISIIEQKRIVEKLDAVHVDVDEFRRLQIESTAELNGLEPAILERAFEGGVKPFRSRKCERKEGFE